MQSFLLWPGIAAILWADLGTSSGIGGILWADLGLFFL